MYMYFKFVFPFHKPVTEVPIEDGLNIQNVDLDQLKKAENTTQVPVF